MTNDGVHLEDCQTNVIGLTELTGLKWRYYVTPQDLQNASTSTAIDPADPIVQAYGRCLNKGHVCTYRRNGTKNELWVFWYAEADFESITELTDGLTESGDLSGDGIGYETRVIFFEALHAKLEVSLRKNGYVRIGKWFANPVELPFLGHRELIAEHMPVFNFHFQVYGENFVAAILSVQRHIPLSWLTKAHFGKQKQAVILGPNGMRGTLVGRPTEPCEKHFDEWQHIHGILPDVEGLPKMVLVEINGVRMLYPTSFVCVVQDENLLIKEISKYHEEDEKVRRHMSGLMVSLMSFEEAVIVGNCAPNEQLDLDLNINCSQPGSTCYCPLCRTMRECGDGKYDMTPEAIRPTTSSSPGGILFKDEKASFSRVPATEELEEELKALEKKLMKEGSTWHMTDNFDGFSKERSLDSVQKDILSGIDKAALPELKRPQSPFTLLNRVIPGSDDSQKNASKENDGLKMYKSAQDLIASCSELLIQRSGDVSKIADPLKVNNSSGKAKKKKVICFPSIVTSDVDDMTCCDKSLTLMRVGTDELSIDMSPASLDDTSEPTYRHELVTSSAPSSSVAPPRLYPEVPTLLSPPVSNEQCEPDVTMKAARVPTQLSPVILATLKVKEDASRVMSENLRSLLPNSNRYMKTAIKRTKTARQTSDYNNLNEKYLKHLSYSHRAAKSESPQAVDFRKLTAKMDGLKKVVPEKELQWFEKEFRPRPQVPTTNYPPRYAAHPNRPHHFHPYYRMAQMGPPGHPHPMQMRPPNMYNFMQQGNGPQQGAMMPPHWNPHHQQIRASPAYMNSPTYMGAMGNAPNHTTFSPSYGNFQNQRNYMATPPHRAALPSPSPGPMSAGTPATPGSMQMNTVFSPQPPSSVASIPAVSSVRPATETDETKALAIVVQLKDTVMNVHVDAGFEACPMCGCSGNIFGRDHGFLTQVQPIPDREVTYWSGLYNNNQGIRCTCGFSAVRHRFLCFNAGLFPEDAREATGIMPPLSKTLSWFDPMRRKDTWLMNLVRQISLTTELHITNARSLKEEVDDKASRFTISEIERLEYLSAMRGAFGGNAANADLLHPWAIQLEARPSKESEWIGQRDDIQAIIDMVKEEVRGKDMNVNDDYGPMTWRQLSLKLARRNEVNSNRHLAEPIPYLIAGCEREHVHRYPKDPKDAQSSKEKERIRDHIFPISVAPTALRHWNSMQLMPYSEPKNVMYIGVVPDSAPIEMKAKYFLENLSVVYENCQLGRHIKFVSDDTPDGLLRMIIQQPQRDRMNPAQYLQSYTDCFEHQILRLLREHDTHFDKRTFHHAAATKPPQPPDEGPPSAASPFIEPSPNSQHDMPHLLDPNGLPHPGQPTPQPRLLNIVEDTYNPEEEIELLPHVVVIYVFNPFSFGSHKREAQHSRDATQALMNAFNEALYNLPPTRRIQLQLEIIDVHKVLNLNTDLPDVDLARPAIYDHLREIAFRVYSQPRTLFAAHAVELVLKSMTAFGLRSRLDLSMTPVRSEFFSIPSNPYILSRPPMINVGPKDEKLAVLNLEEKVIFISYCLLGQDWLLVAATDSQGKMLDNAPINLTTRTQYPRYPQAKTQILEAMGRLWEYVMGVLSRDVKNWRVVINRLGRIGHGEFKAWAHLLSKSNLQRYGNTLKEKCKTCNGGAGYKDSPVILSACLVSLEPEARFRVVPTATKKSSDAISSTHIMVIPNTSSIQTDHHETDKGVDFDNMDFFVEEDEDVTSALIMDVGRSDDGQKQNQGRQQRSDFFNADATDININNQPLATGYYISTAPAADLPDWFWSSCPSAQFLSTTHLRSSLHLTITNSQSEEVTLKQSSDVAHPLEANATEDVLRFVLESYNALSWLNINFSTGDRRSCLPVHIQALLRFYHNVSKLMA